MSHVITVATTVRITIGEATHDLTIADARQLVAAIEGAIHPSPPKNNPNTNPSRDLEREFRKLRDEMEKGNPRPNRPYYPPYAPSQPSHPTYPWHTPPIYCQLVTPP